MSDAAPDFIEALVEAGLVGRDANCRIEALTGGVSSDIVRVEAGGRQFCVKRALPKLKVAAEWRAPVERNRSEVEWMRVAARLAPGAVPAVLADRSDAGWFAMEFLAPDAHPLWKAQLRDGHIEADFAARVGMTLARIHSGSAQMPDLPERFSTDHIFHPIRLEPYLAATALRHPDCAARLNALITQTTVHKRALVHGDVSPKNILCGPAGPVFLDAECAWWGDPAFDLAFCLNHLLLKCVWRPQWTARYLDSFDRLAHAYLGGVDWEAVEDIEARAAGLLPGLFLARIDGKSPVEYIESEADRERVRRVARSFLLESRTTLAPLREVWESEMRS